MPEGIFLPILSQRGQKAGLNWKSSFFGLDASLVACAALLFSFGTLVVYTALHGSLGFEGIWLRHLTALALAVLLCFFILFFPSAVIFEMSGIFYFLCVGLLIAVLFGGKVVHGSKSWFDLGPLQFQPSELAKLATILYLSRLGARIKERDMWLPMSGRLKIFAVALLPVVLVLAQRDLSSSLGFLFILFAYAWAMEMLSRQTIAVVIIGAVASFIFLLGHIVAGLTLTDLVPLSQALSAMGFGPGAASGKWLLWAASLAVASVLLYRILKGLFILSPRTTWLWAAGLMALLAGSWCFGFGASKALKGYQKNRMVSFLFPAADPFGSGYNITQSKIAIGSGGLVGQGILLGSQTALGFLPERHTDFAFAALGETMGFMGAVGALAVLSFLFWRLARFMELARESWDRLVVIGLFGLWFGEVSVNIAYVTGMFPVLGIGLPFFSYGGSRLVVNGIEMGLLLSLSRSFYVYR